MNCCMLRVVRWTTTWWHFVIISLNKVNVTLVLKLLVGRVSVYTDLQIRSDSKNGLILKCLKWGSHWTWQDPAENVWSGELSNIYSWLGKLTLTSLPCNFKNCCAGHCAVITVVACQMENLSAFGWRIINMTYSG